jgi:predicted transcriptional regulator
VFLRRFRLLLSSVKAKKNSRSNRNSLDIVKDILSVASIKARKTRIMYQANLSYVQVQKYLHDLLEKDLLDHDGNSFYFVTKKGLRFLKLYDEHVELLRKLEEQVDQCNRDRMRLDQMCSNHNDDCDAKNTRKAVLLES